MRDEDLLKQVARDGKVVIGGKEFPIKTPDPTPRYDPDVFKQVYEGTWANMEPGQDRVRYPEFLIEPNPNARIDDFLSSSSNKPAERPEVLLREGIRAALRGGLSQEKIKEIFELELVAHVMES